MEIRKVQVTDMMAAREARAFRQQGINNGNMKKRNLFYFEYCGAGEKF